MSDFEIDDKVSIAFNKMPDEERKRLEGAVSTAKLGGNPKKSKVDQGNHQTVAQTGTVLEKRLTSDGVKYLVLVDLKNSPGKKRVIDGKDLTLI